MVTAKHIGRTVVFGEDLQGVLRDVMEDWEDLAASPADRVKKPMAFISPVKGGGREWMVPPSQVRLA